MKKVILPAILGLLLFGSLFYFGVKQYKDSFSVFENEGYVINTVVTKNENDSSNTVETSKQYFSDNTEYKKGLGDKVTFENSDKEEVKTSKKTFVHYLNGSIGCLSKSVIIDLDDVSGKVVKYYNLFPSTVLESKNNSYGCKISATEKYFKNFLMRIDDNKYMAVAEKMTLYIDGEPKEIKDNYLEIEFMDGNIVRLTNQEVGFQNINADFAIEFANGVKIDLATKNIYAGKNKIINMTQMTIDSDDNIEIVEDEKEKEEESELILSNPLENLETGDITSPKVSNGDEELIDEDARVKDPIFTVDDFSVTSNKMSATVSYEDPNKIISLINNKQINNKMKWSLRIMKINKK